MTSTKNLIGYIEVAGREVLSELGPPPSKSSFAAAGYLNAMKIELSEADPDMKVERVESVPMIYKGQQVGEVNSRADLLVDDSVAVEVIVVTGAPYQVDRSSDLYPWWDAWVLVWFHVGGVDFATFRHGQEEKTEERQGWFRRMKRKFRDDV